MLDQLDARPGHRVLEIGAGTGYNAALLAELVSDVRRVGDAKVAQPRGLLGEVVLGRSALCMSAIRLETVDKADERDNGCCNSEEGVQVPLDTRFARLNAHGAGTGAFDGCG